MTRRWSRRWCCRGSVSVEMAILFPAFLLIIFGAIWFGRIAVAANAIDVAAHDAARAASISRSAAAADVNARDAAHQALQRQGLNCLNEPDVFPDTSQFGLDTLELTWVEVTVVCEVSFSDISLPGVPDSWTVTSTFLSPIDTFRERQ